LVSSPCPRKYIIKSKEKEIDDRALYLFVDQEEKDPASGIPLSYDPSLSYDVRLRNNPDLSERISFSGKGSRGGQE
jgi:hypothetical protein